MKELSYVDVSQDERHTSPSIRINTTQQNEDEDWRTAISNPNSAVSSPNSIKSGRPPSIFEEMSIEAHPRHDDSGISLASSTTSHQDIQQVRTQSSVTSQRSESTTLSYTSPAFDKKLNNRFRKAVMGKKIDTLLIHNWIRDPPRRARLNPEDVQSAVFQLAGQNKARDPRFRDHAVCAILDECNVDLERPDEVYKSTPLILATAFGHEAIVKLLITRGADLQAKDGRFNRTALSWAGRNGYIGIANLLLEALRRSNDQESVHSRDIDGCTALDLAKRRKHVDLARLLEFYEDG